MPDVDTLFVDLPQKRTVEEDAPFEELIPQDDRKQRTVEEEDALIQELREQNKTLEASTALLVSQKMKLVLEREDMKIKIKEGEKRLLESMESRAKREAKFQEEIKRQKTSMNALFQDLTKSKAECKELEKMLSIAMSEKESLTEESKESKPSINQSDSSSPPSVYSLQAATEKQKAGDRQKGRWGNIFARRASPMTPRSMSQKMKDMESENAALKERLIYLQGVHKTEMKRARDTIHSLKTQNEKLQRLQLVNTQNICFEDVPLNDDNNDNEEGELVLEVQPSKPLFSSLEDDDTTPTLTVTPPRTSTSKNTVTPPASTTPTSSSPEISPIGMSRLDFLRLKRRSIEKRWQKTPTSKERLMKENTAILRNHPVYNGGKGNTGDLNLAPSSEAHD